MKNYSTENIINFALAGHASSGKTMLAEAMAFNAKVINRMGSIEDGNTISDYHHDEIKSQHSISSSLLNFEWEGRKLNIIDTPGYLDFQGEVKSAMHVADFVAVVINAVNGIEVGTELVNEYATKDYTLPQLIIINMLDRENVDFDKIIEMAKNRYGNKVFPIQIPIDVGENFHQIGDVLRKEIHNYETKSTGNFNITNADEELKSKLDSLHNELIELIAESDDTLLETFFDQGELTEEQLRSGLHHAFLTGGLIPVFCVSGKKNVGVKRLMDVLSKYAPCASDFKEVSGLKPGTEEKISHGVSINDPTSAFVFKTISEAHMGELSFFRVYSGKLAPSDDLKNTTRDQNEKLRQIFYLNGKERKDTSSVIAGDIAAVLKLKNTHTNDTLSDIKTQIVLPKIKFPNPNIRLAIIPKSKGDEDKISEGLSTLHDEDPTFQYSVDSELKQTIISGQGELHLNTIMNKLKRKFHVELESIPPKIAYRETITVRSNSKYRHKKQSGGSGQFAEVWLKIEPKPRGTGIDFTQNLVGQNVDRSFVSSVEKSINSTCIEGVIAGCKVVDLKVDFYDGKMHPVDSNDMAFQIAGKHAFIDAFKTAKPKLLEPIYKIIIKVPESAMGDVMGDISQRRGKVSGMETDGHFQIITADVPLATIHDYSTALRSMTGGRGLFSIEFSRYEDMPKVELLKVIKDFEIERKSA